MFLDLIDSEKDVDGLLSSCVNATDVKCRTHVVIIALNYFGKSTFCGAGRGQGGC